MYAFAGRRIGLKVATVHFVDLGELTQIRQENTAFYNIGEVSTGSLKDRADVFHYFLRGIFYAGGHQLVGSRIHRYLSGNKKQVAGPDGLIIRADWRGCPARLNDMLVHGAKSNKFAGLAAFLMPDLLFIDSTDTVCSIALSRGEEIVACQTHDEPKEQAAVFTDLLGQVLAAAQANLQEVNGIVVCAGPGSYTGIRVGMSFAKGLCFALDIPLLLFDRLYLIYLSLGAQQGRTLTESDASSVALKARAGEYFFARYRAEGEVLTAPVHVFEADLIQQIEPADVMLTDDPGLLPEHAGRIVVPRPFVPDHAAWLNVALQRWEAKQFDDLAYSAPFYLKPAFTTTPKKKW